MAFDGVEAAVATADGGKLERCAPEGDRGRFFTVFQSLGLFVTISANPC